MAGEYTDRARLHKAIERVREAEDRRTRLAAGRNKHHDEGTALTRALERAEAALEQAKASESAERTFATGTAQAAERAVAAVLRGPAAREPSRVERACALVADAKAGLARQEKELPALQAAERAVRADLEAAHEAVKEAISAVLAPCKDEVIAALKECWQRIADLDGVLGLLMKAAPYYAGPVYSPGLQNYTPNPEYVQTFRDSITALSNDAATPIPIVTTRNITKVVRTLHGGSAQAAPPGSRIH